MSTRVDLSPEPTHAVDEFYNMDTMRYEAELSPVPAAGRLGIQEVVCNAFDHDAYTIGYTCPVCRATV